MTKIHLNEPDGPYACDLDTGVMDVTLTEVFNGVVFVTEDGERLAVAMRDSGFEVHYFGSDKPDEGTHLATGFDLGWFEFKAGRLPTQGKLPAALLTPIRRALGIDEGGE